MKNRNILILAVMVSSVFFLCSYREGAAAHGGYDCTGAESVWQNPTGCSVPGNNCHATSATAGITLVFEVDSAGVPVSSYIPGMTYTVKLVGTNTTSSSQPRFGFQVAAILGSVGPVTPTNAGTFQQTGLPANVQYTAAQVASQYFAANIIEQSAAMAPTSGNGGNGTTYSVSFTWTAPAAGTGTVSLWSALNAVNNNGGADIGDLWNTKNLVLTENTSTATSISGPTENMELGVYPNPSTDLLQIDVLTGDNGECSLSVFDLQGRLMLSQKAADRNTLNIINWSAGIYFVQLSKEGVQKTVKIVKK